MHIKMIEFLKAIYLTYKNIFPELRNSIFWEKNNLNFRAKNIYQSETILFFTLKSQNYCCNSILPKKFKHLQIRMMSQKTPLKLVLTIQNCQTYIFRKTASNDIDAEV